MSRDDSKYRLRTPAVAGRFYSAGRNELQAEIRSYFQEAKTALRPDLKPQALIVPHAGYIFSGKTAASAYNQLPDNAGYETVFILASSHQMQFPGASVYSSGNYQTPLGIIDTDYQTCRKLLDASNLFNCREEAHLQEHSLEVQLPFIQMKLKPGFKMVPIILGTRHTEDCRKLANVLKPYFIPKNLFVISSDFSHYPDYEDAREIDSITTKAILTGSPGELIRTLDQHKELGIHGLVTSLCGWTSVLTLLYMITGRSMEMDWVDYHNSGDNLQFGSHDRVVGYSALVVYPPAPQAYQLTEPEKVTLLQLARASIEATVSPGCKVNPDLTGQTGTLGRPAGAFVSIYIAGKLRGCIGSFEDRDSLAEVIYRAAASAARDHRFKSPEAAELNDLVIEISVLTPLKRIWTTGEIELGRHGIYIRKGSSSGTFLPQVGSTHGWSVEEYIGRCSRDKAGLGWDGWRDAMLYTYEAIIFRSSAQSEDLQESKSCE
jgi:MEMO1 family protein